MQGYYRFWSLDPVYAEIVELVKREGTPHHVHGRTHRGMRLFDGDIYEFGIAPGRTYPEGSMILLPNLHGKTEKPTTSFPAILNIVTESSERLEELEQRYGLDRIPRDRREALHPDLDWAA